MERSWLNSICQRDLPEIRSAPGTKSKVSGTITFHTGIVKSRTCVTLGVVDVLAVAVFIGTTVIDCYIKSGRPAERKIVP